MKGQGFDPNLIVAVAALIVSVISLAISWRSARIQNRVAKLEQQIMEIELAEKRSVVEQSLLSRVEARHIKVGPKAHRIRISNTGKVRAFGIRYEASEETTDIVLFHDKEPYDFLDPGESYDENIVVTWGAPQKFKVITYWKDDAGNELSRENVISY